MPVWPTSSSSSSDGAATSMMVLGDGGNLDNVGLFALLQVSFLLLQLLPQGGEF